MLFDPGGYSQGNGKVLLTKLPLYVLDIVVIASVARSLVSVFSFFVSSMYSHVIFVIIELSIDEAYNIEFESATQNIVR